jgi:hypothetical protein
VVGAVLMGLQSYQKIEVVCHETITPQRSSLRLIHSF